MSFDSFDYYQEKYRAIAGSLARGEVGLLIGAGMAKDSNLPDTKTIQIRMMRRVLLGEDQEETKTNPEINEYATKYPFEAIAHLLKPKLPYENLEKWMKEKGGLTGQPPGEAYQNLYALYHLLSHRFPKLIFTTNFDTLIEDAFPAGKAHTITSVNLKDLPEVKKQRQIAVVHLHGCVTYQDSIIVGEGLQATLEGPIFDLFRASMASDIFVVVGYSLGDTELRRIFFDIQRIADTRNGLNKRTFSVSPANGHPGENQSEAGIARMVWDKRKVEHIAATAGEFFRAIFQVTDDFLLVKMKAEVAKAVGKDPETLSKMLESAVKPFRLLTANDMLVYLYYTLPDVENKE